MKILHVVNNIDPKLGGSVEAARQMAIAMRSCGVETEVLTMVEPQEGWSDNWPAPVHALGGTVSRYCYTRRLAPWLRRNHNRYSALIIHGVWRYPSWGVQRVLQESGTAYFLLTHGMLDPWFEKAYPWKHAKKALWWHLREHRVLRDARAVLFSCQTEMVLSRKSFRPYRCRELVAGMGTASPPPCDPQQPSAFLEMFPSLRNKRNIVFLSRIHKKKGCDLLIRAFRNIATCDPALHLVMVGDDEEGWRPELDQIASSMGVADRITWTGHIDSHLKWGAFRAAEVFVLPSHTENYGQAIVEAMACGVPVLISDKVNIWREVVDDGAGLVAPDDLDGTISLLQRWLALTPEQRDRMRVNALHCYKTRFELQGFTERFVDLLRHELDSPVPVEV